MDFKKKQQQKKKPQNFLYLPQLFTFKFNEGRNVCFTFTTEITLQDSALHIIPTSPPLPELPYHQQP